ncbi:MAG: hypothetical protein GXP63_03870 [DPANN group archaeon]|nr:hypothetical protein [DPANN group archaeon]
MTALGKTSRESALVLGMARDLKRSFAFNGMARRHVADDAGGIAQLIRAYGESIAESQQAELLPAQ